MKQAISEQLAEIQYREILMRPKLDNSLERFLNKYSELMTEYHIQDIEGLTKIIERAYSERLDMLILHEHNGYLILVWKS